MPEKFDGAKEIYKINSLASKFLKWLGTLISIGAIVFFIWMIAKSINTQDISTYIVSNMKNILLSILVYSVAWVPISMAWVITARQCEINAKLSVLLNILYLSQAAKYLPGNIGQYIGRIYLAGRSGIKLKTTTLAMAVEIAAILIACAILTSAMFLLNLNVDTTLTVNWFYEWIIKYTGLVITFIALGLFIFITYSKKVFFKQKLLGFSLVTSLMIINISCFAVSNVIIVSNMLNEINFTIILNIFSAVVVSWFAGFITPGSPAGIGIREIVLFALLSGVIAENSLILAAVIFRLVTIIGDLFAFIIGLVLRMKNA